MDEMELLFSSLDEEEMEELIKNIEAEKCPEISNSIKKRIASDKKGGLKHFPLKKVLPFAAAFCVVIACAVAVKLDSDGTFPSTELQTESSTTVASPAQNPLMDAISDGDDDKVEDLLTSPALLSQEMLEFSLNASGNLSYETIRRLAVSVKEKLGTTGLDSLLEASILGDSKAVLEELKKRDSMLMTPFEKLSFFFAVAFCDSEVVDEYIRLGYDVGIKDLHGNSIYAIAEKYGNEENMSYAKSKGITS